MPCTWLRWRFGITNIGIFFTNKAVSQPLYLFRGIFYTRKDGLYFETTHWCDCRMCQWLRRWCTVWFLGEWRVVSHRPRLHDDEMSKIVLPALCKRTTRQVTYRAKYRDISHNFVGHFEWRHLVKDGDSKSQDSQRRLIVYALCFLLCYDISC